MSTLALVLVGLLRKLLFGLNERMLVVLQPGAYILFKLLVAQNAELLCALKDSSSSATGSSEMSEELKFSCWFLMLIGKTMNLLWFADTHPTLLDTSLLSKLLSSNSWQLTSLPGNGSFKEDDLKAGSAL